MQFRSTVYILFLISVCLAVAAYFFWKCPVNAELEYVESKPIDVSALLNIRSARGDGEDPHARLKYEHRMIADPNSGKVPSNIHKRELNFSKSLPTRKDKQLKSARKSQTSWESRGPFNLGGRTRALALDATDENIILAGGVSGGMWRSDDDGVSWTKTTAPLALHSVTAISQDLRTGREDTWYYGTGELRGNTARGGQAPFRGDGIFKSTDGGRSWDILDFTQDGLANFFNSPFNYVWSLVTNPTREDVDEIFAAVFGGIIRSQDGGATWETVLGADLLGLPDTSDLNQSAVPFFSDLDITSDGVLYATLSTSTENDDSPITPLGGIFRSVDGENWTNITPNGFPVFYRRVVIGIAPSNENIVYIVADSEENQLWRYTHLFGTGPNITGTWEDLTENIPMFGGQVGDFETQRSYDMVIETHPQDENVVYLGGTNLYRSTDGFRSTINTTWIGGYDPEAESVSKYPSHHPDQHEIVFYPANPDRMLTGNDGGVFRTENNLAPVVSYTSLNNGYITTQFHALAIDKQTDTEFILGGMHDNGSYISQGSNFVSDWIRTLGGDGTFCAVAGNGDLLYFSFQNSHIFRMVVNNNFQIVSFTRVDPVGGGSDPDQPYLFVNPFVLDPSNNNMMYLAGGDIVWRNDNLSQIPASSNDPAGLNWFRLENTEIMEGQISALDISREPRNILYYGTSDGKLFRVDDADRSGHNRISLEDPDFPDGAYVTSIAIDPRDADKVLVAFSNYNVQSVFYSDNGGVDFEPISGNLEDDPITGMGDGPSVRWVEILPMENDGLLFFAATSIGLFSTEDINGLSTEWVMEGSEEIGNVVIPMVRSRFVDGRVAVGTHGRGAFVKEFAGAESLDLTPDVDQVALLQNFPNPFAELTTIPFNIPEEGAVIFTIYTTTGKKLKTILTARQFAGENRITWDGTDGNGVPVGDGIYIYRMDYFSDSGQRIDVARKMILRR